MQAAAAGAVVEPVVEAEALVEQVAEALVEPVAEALVEPVAVVEPVALAVVVEPVALAVVVQALVERAAEALVEQVLVAQAVEAQVLVEQALEARALEPLAEVELVELAPQELAPLEPPVREQERVPEQQREPAVEAAAVALMLSNIFTPVHTDGLTPTGSARECFKFKGAIGGGLLTPLLIGSTNARPSLVRMCAGKRRRCVMFSGLTRLSR
jgi:hypothetical protein